MTEPDGRRRAVLALADGSLFSGHSKGYDADGFFAVGEVVFNTSITGYQEILTDPSYARQIVNFTHPHIGNTGVNPLDNEAEEILAGGIIARRIESHFSNWRATASLSDFLRDRRVAAMDGVDTRAITRRLREHGSVAGCIAVAAEEETTAACGERALAQARAFGGLSGSPLAEEAGSRPPLEWTEGVWQQADNAYAPATAAGLKVVVLDCGCKRNILRALTERGCSVRILPYDSPAEDILRHRPDGVLLSNGPGDPAPCESAIATARALIAARLPLFGLCLGHQIVAAALGAKTEKMKFGHHGANHPVQRLADGRVLITSQNHGFAVRSDSLPANVRASYVSLFDGSLQGLTMTDSPLLTFQGHPEASPGPHDAGSLFDDFITLMRNAQAKRH